MVNFYVISYIQMGLRIIARPFESSRRFARNPIYISGDGAHDSIASERTLKWVYLRKRISKIGDENHGEELLIKLFYMTITS